MKISLGEWPRVSVSGPRKWVPFALGAALILALIISIASAAVWQERQRSRERATVATQSIARLFDQHVSDLIDKIDLGLLLAVNVYQAQPATKNVDARALNAYLERLTADLPDVVGVRIANRDGIVNFGSGLPLGNPINIADRDYFISARRQSDTGLMVAAPVVSRITGQWVIVLSRRINAPDGTFAGVVYATLATSRIDKTFALAELGPHGAASIRTADLALVHRFPDTKNAVGSKDVSKQLRAAITVHPDAGDYIAPTAIDGIERSNAYRKIGRYPLYVIVGLATEDYLAGLTNTILMFSTLVLVASLVTILSTVLIYRANRRLDRHRLHLEDVVTELTTELVAAKTEAERANNAKSRFMAAASHDLRQPLSALSLYVGMLENKVPPADQMLVSKTKACVATLSELLTDLLDLSKLDAEVMTAEVSDFPVAELMANLEAIHGPEALLKGLSLRCLSSKLNARTDPVLYQRLLGNLVANAIRYTERGGVLVGCRRRGGKTWIEVWDTGIGIPAGKTAEIFEEFKQLGNDERNGAKGSGLGLAIVARTAALLGLQIRVTSRAGKGSMFAIELPLGQARRPASLVKRQVTGVLLPDSAEQPTAAKTEVVPVVLGMRPDIGQSRA
ncbi:MAG: ATP-binding protein [Bacteroidota bacterium]